MNLYSNKLFLAVLTVTLLFFAVAANVNAGAAASQQKPAGQEPEPEYTEEEYDAYDKAVQEPDLDKKAAELNAFVAKYPKSKLMTYIVTAYQTLLYDYSKSQKYDKLEPAAEQWLRTNPGDLQTMAYIAEAAQKLGRDQKYAEYAEQIYAQKSSGNLAYYIAQAYKKIGNDAKYTEWVLKVFTYPEFASEYGMRYAFVQKYVDQKEYPKAAEYAQLTLKSVDAAKKPDATAQADWDKQILSVRRACQFIIGMNEYQQDKFAEAITSFQTALRAEKFAEGFFYIGLSEWKLNKIDEAMLAFARSEKMGGPLALQAKGHLESLYKSLHNNMIIGIEKIYKRATEEAYP
jgi:hypothetical protein